MTWAWMKEHEKYEDGRKAWKFICQHYDGPGEKEKRLSQARENIKVSHYKNEHNFSFEHYVTKIKFSYDVLADNSQPMNKRMKVDDLYAKINSTNVQVTHIVNQVLTGVVSRLQVIRLVR